MISMSNFSEEFKRKSFNKIAGLVAENYVDQSLILNNWDNITNRYKRNLINISTLEDFYRYIDNMLLELRDPHTRFKNNNIIKIPSVLLVYINNEIFIAATFYNDSKLKIGSKLLKINGEKIQSILSKLSNNFKFKSKNIIKHNIIEELNSYIKEGDILECEVEGKIIVEAVSSNMLFNNTFKNINNKQIIESNNFSRIIDDTLYVKLPTFRMESMIDRLETILKEGASDKIIIDVRENKGGFIELAKRAAAFFLENDKVIGYTINKDNIKCPIEIHVKDSYLNKFKKIIILTNENSGSCTETIFINALKNSSNKISIIGSKTMGLINQATEFKFNDGSLLQITTKKNLDINGVELGYVGLEPDVLVDLDFNIFRGVDNQLNEALRVINNKEIYV